MLKHLTSVRDKYDRKHETKTLELQVPGRHNKDIDVKYVKFVGECTHL